MPSLLPIVLLAFDLLSPTLASNLSLTGLTVVLDGTPFYVPAEPVAVLDTSSLPRKIKDADLTPLTVIATDDLSYDAQAFEAAVSNFTSTDDVFSAGFLESVYVQYTGQRHGRHGLAPKLTNVENVTDAVWSNVVSSNESIPNGPYFLSSSGSVYQAWRLYSDLVDAFSETLFPAADGSFSILPANVAGMALAVAVPSRLYYTKTADKPLAGVRLGIKDIFDIAGVRTSNGNRAWYHLYPPAKENALVVQRLIDAGAVIVGKMKTSQFANGERPTADWVDQFSPFNPRGDGYQDPGSSSSGPAAGAAAYDWLDLTLGSDTGDSIRAPANVQGIYGNRPSHDLVSLKGAMSLAPMLDTPGFLTRDPLLWAEASKVLYAGNISFPSARPRNILTTNFPTNATKLGDDLLIGFLSQVTSLLQAKPPTAIDLSAYWATTSNTSTPLETYTNLTYPILIAQSQTKAIRDPFYADYAALHAGRKPFINPSPLARWAFGETFPPTQLAKEDAKRATFASWFSQEILPPSASAGTCSDALLFYVGSAAGSTTHYRNAYQGPPEPPTGWTLEMMSTLGGGPDFVLPVGEAGYVSEVTGRVEMMPVTVNVVAAKGCDGLVYGVVRDLVDAGILKKSLAGRSGVDGGEVLLRRRGGDE
jgi:Asp-tRNA(Asn)/Glu-tRNA(Gln) amidotransferase A subunit family amidase